MLKREVQNTMKSFSIETCNNILNKYVRVALEWIVSWHSCIKEWMMLILYIEDIKEI